MSDIVWEADANKLTVSNSLFESSFVTIVLRENNFKENWHLVSHREIMVA